MKKFKGCTSEAQILQSTFQSQFCLESQISSYALPSGVFLPFLSSDCPFRSCSSHSAIFLSLPLCFQYLDLIFYPFPPYFPPQRPSSSAQPLLNCLLLCSSQARCRLFLSPFSSPSPVYMRALRAASPCALMRVVQIAPVLQLEETLISGAPCCARVHQGQVSPLMLPHAVILLCTVSCVRTVFPQCIL